MPPAARPSRASRRTSPLAGGPFLPRAVAAAQLCASSSRSSDAKSSGALSLETFASDLVHGLLQHDDAIFERVYARDFSRDLDETANGQSLDYAGMREFCLGLRRQVADRRVTAESFVVAEAAADDDAPTRGTFSHEFTFTGVQEAGAPVIVTIVSVVNAAVNDEGRWQVVKESFVTKMV